MSQSPEKKKKRASSRLSYVQPAQCIYQDQVLEATTQNISTSGVLIAISQKIDLKTQITMSWEDPESGQIEGSFYVIREFQTQGTPDDKFYYGLRYYKLEMESKERLLALLNRLKGKTKKEAEKISLDSIYGVLDQKEAFFKTSLESVSGVHDFYKTFLEKLKHYEIEAFQLPDNPYTQIIRQYVVYQFQASILKSIVPFVIKKPGRYVEYLKRVHEVLTSLEEVALEEDVVFHYIDNAKADDNEIAAMKMNYNESSNRSFYGKQGMMEKVIKEMGKIELSPDIRAYIDAINERYDRSVELTNPNMKLSDIHTVSKYTPEPFEAGSGGEMIAPGAINANNVKKVIFLAILMLFLVFRSISGFIGDWLDKREYIGDLDLPVAIKSVKRDGYQLNVSVKTEQWDALNATSEEVVVKKIQAYLRTEDRIKVGIVRTTDGEIKKIVTDVN